MRKILQDTDPMPYGKHGPNGTEPCMMQDVPAQYLHWLWVNGLKNETKTSNVADYIQRNLEALKKEWPDAIWS